METNTPNVPQQPLSKKQQRRLAKMQQKQERASSGTSRKAGSRVVVWLIILAILGFFVYAIGKLATSGPATDGTQTGVEITATDHVLGNRAATVQLIEYADFQCPGCAAFSPIVKELMTEYNEKVAFAYRHYPLPQHQHAKAMAYAAEAAAKQNKFWEMSNLIYSNQNRWSSLVSVESIINGYATSLGLDMVRFETDFESSEAVERVSADYKSGVSYGVNSTPTFFLNGTKIALPRNYNEFKLVIEGALKAAATPTADAEVAQ